MRKNVPGDQPPEDFAYLEQIRKIQDLANLRLLDGSQRTLPEVAELCEDIANLYLNVADDIRAGLAANLRGNSDRIRERSDQQRALGSILAAWKD